MTKAMIDTDILRAGIVMAIRERGADYRYRDEHDDCFYRIDDKPGCLLGHAINNIDHELYEVMGNEEEDTDAFPFDEVERVARKSVTERALHAGTVAQTCQDLGGTWGEALEAFDKCVAGIY